MNFRGQFCVVWLCLAISLIAGGSPSATPGGATSARRTFTMTRILSLPSSATAAATGPLERASPGIANISNCPRVPGPEKFFANWKVWNRPAIFGWMADSLAGLKTASPRRASFHLGRRQNYTDRLARWTGTGAGSAGVAARGHHGWLGTV